MTPPAPKHVRDISPNITTTYLPQQHCVRAEYKCVTEHSAPSFAPFIFTRMSIGVGQRIWRGETVLQAYNKDEVGALTELLLNMIGIGITPDVAVENTLAALRVATKRTPWELQPLGIRGPKPKTPRYQWRDSETGKVVHLHKDTMKRHRDPNCTCRHCTIFVPPTDTESTETP